MPKRKLTPKLRQYLQKNRWKVKQSDYTGDALSYLKQLRASAKRAKKKKESVAKVGNVVIAKNSDLYHIIEASAKLKGQSVKKFIAANKDAIRRLMEGDRVVISRETSYAISDINALPDKSVLFVNGQETSKGDAIYALQNLASVSSRYANVVVINYELSYDLMGNLYMGFPMPEDYAELLDEIEDMEFEDEQGDAIADFLNRYENIVYIRS